MILLKWKPKWSTKIEKERLLRKKQMAQDKINAISKKKQLEQEQRKIYKARLDTLFGKVSSDGVGIDEYDFDKLIKKLKKYHPTCEYPFNNEYV